ncbi:glycosyltransferase [Lactococcus fujiensis]|uniref:Glycosyltransferase 2-like domain-containing protein n=1 Tax=Lactococcus fujiensis JCM 16395 TaxID=1291764 RepID=A0A2A5RMA9_9LACT|nr:glycosyltransferase [Lactococcus fujiensis]PCS00444.1 hypothetical protein RT41_GL001331 [Lactococcus fujiensis JCM 16395]
MEKTAVLMATYNAADLIVSQLDTIRLQELPADYVIFRDDHSSDQTVQFLKNYIEKYELKGWQIFENDKNIGWRLNFRLLLIDGLKTDASFFFFSDQDNIWLADKNKVQIEVMLEFPEIELLSADIEIKKLSQESSDLPSWFTYFQFDDREEMISKYPKRLLYQSYRVGWVDVMRRGFVEDMIEFWQPDYNVTHDVLNSTLSSLLGTGFNLNRIVGTHVLHQHNATGKKLLTLRSPKNVHLSELKKFVGFYDILYHVLEKRKINQAEEMKNYRDFYQRRLENAKSKHLLPVVKQILVDWHYYPAMSSRVRDLYFAFRK